jgi:hypothetical protein
MATFPTLTPSSRTFTPGRHPHSEIPTLDGLQIRARTSNVILEQQLRLTFTALTEAQMLSIRSHYIGQQGRFLSFVIPDSLLSGMTTPANFTPTGYSWIYSSSPLVEDIPGTQRYNVSIELVTVPPEGANINGAEFTVSVELAAGTAAATANISGAELTVIASIQGGVVADNASAGLSEIVTASLAAGTATGGAGGDPYWANVQMLLWMNGTNGSTTFTDSSTTGITVTTHGNAQISTAQSKFGGASGLFDGSGDHLSTATLTSISPGTGAFTIEFWVRWADRTGAQTPFTFVGAFDITKNGSNTLACGDIMTTASSLTSTTTFADNQWYHIAVSRGTGAARLYVDGVEESSVSGTNLDLSNQSIYVGRRLSPAFYLNGYIDDLRLTIGVDRYTANFTPPTAQLPNS